VGVFCDIAYIIKDKGAMKGIGVNDDGQQGEEKN
jgi:hypothetical protein